MQSNYHDPIIVSAINAFQDNYIWAISHQDNQYLALVDPGDAHVCIDYIEQHNQQLCAILLTHHHQDHTGGVEQLKRYCQENAWPLIIYGPANDNISAVEKKLTQGDEITIAELNLSLTVIDVPGHTKGHIAYLAENKLFCGDTLFSAGCGRLFEGTSEQMYHSLNKLAALCDHTLVYCTHEYTLANLSFALTVEPSNSELVNYYNQAQQLIAKEERTLPSSIMREKLINPFLRCQQYEINQSVQEYCGEQVALGLETFTQLRLWKDNF